MLVQLNESFHDCKAGDVIDVPATVARDLLHKGKAFGGAIDTSNVKKVNFQYRPTKEEATIKRETRTEKVETDFPKDNGAGWYLLSNGEKVRGEKKAIKAENELHNK